MSKRVGNTNVFVGYGISFFVKKLYLQLGGISLNMLMFNLISQFLIPDELLTKQVDPNEQCLPSPNKLKRKVIIKVKRNRL